jgi:hypothetical protein
MMNLFGLGYTLTEFREACPVVREGKRLHISSIRTASVSKMLVFAHINRHNKSFSVDYPLFLCFNNVQGYAPFTYLLTNSPTGFKSRKSIAS